MAQAVRSAQERRLVERLHALRNLPPGTSLPQIPKLEDQEILNRILQFPEEVDVMRWLENNFDSNMAKIALRISIEKIGTMCRHLSIASSRVALPDYYQQMLGGLLSLSDDDVLFHQLDDLEKDGASEDLLYNTFRRMRLLSQESPILSVTFQGRDENEQFLADLLRLPQQDDPVSWLRETHSVFAIRLVLSHLLDRFNIDHGSLIALPTVRNIKVNKHFYGLPGVNIKIEQIILKSTCFLVQARVVIARNKLPFHGDTMPSIITWSGFERVVDNLGYYYITWIERIHSGDMSFHRYQEQITMAFYPAPPIEVTSLTFSSQPMLIETHAVLEGGHRVQLPDIRGNDLLWHVSIPK